MTLISKADEELGEKLYETYGKPLESAHWGEFVVVARDGRFLLGSDEAQLLLEGEHRFGRGIFLYKIGRVATARLR